MNAIDLPALSVRAALAGVDERARTADLIFSTGAPVLRADYATGKPYYEVLSLDPGHVRLDRLNSGAPLLNAHAAYSITDVLGTVQPRSARVANGQGIATVRFSRRPAVEPVFRDVVDGIIRGVSVGYRVYALREETHRGADGIPTRTAVDWEPYEISMVPMAADVGARVRAGDTTAWNRCVVVSLEDADRLRRWHLAAAQSC